MKLTILSILLFLSAYWAFGQEIPATEFQSSLSSTILSLHAGDSKDVKVTLRRSKAWRKSAATLSIPAGLPEGVAISFEPANGYFNESIMKVTIDPDAKPGNHTILVRTEMRHLKKGNLLRLEIGNQSIANTANQ